MADEHNPVEVAETAPVAIAAAAEPAIATQLAEETTLAVAAKPATTAEPAATETTIEAAAAAPVEEAKKVESKPVEEGSLEHKGQGANFPKNLIFSKKFVWYGAEAADLKAIKLDKAVDVAYHITAWASETGKGLLFFSEKADKSAPSGAILLTEASEPTAEGVNKFHFTAHGHKHTFKAATTTERDSWVAQLKTKIAEAKELAITVVESDAYKKTLESLKPAKKEEAVALETTAAEEIPATAAVEETPANAAPTAEEPAKEDTKRRSGSRKRTSIFGALLGKKEAAEKAADIKAAESENPAAEVIQTHAAETSETPAEAPATEEAKFAHKKEEPVKPAAAKRQSIFNLSFGKKKTIEEPAKENPATTEPVAETAPVIPAPEITDPLSNDVTSATTVPTEIIEGAVPIANGDNNKRDIKSDKRKSSLPFAFGKKEKAPASDEEGDKVKSPSPFSKLRATIKGKGRAEKTEDKKEVSAVAEAGAAKEDESAKEELKQVGTEAAPVEEPAKVIDTTPAVTAAA